MLKKWVPYWTIPGLMIFATGTVWLRLTVIRTTYAINQAQQQIEKASQDREMFQLKVAALRSPRRLEVLARTVFGLSQPRVDQVVRFKKNEMAQNDP